MPIITHFKGRPPGNTPAKQRKQFDPEDTALAPKVNGDKRERMASPVILKAMWMGDGYAPIALLLPHDHIGHMRVMLDGFDASEQPGRPWWPEGARIAMTTGTSPNPLDGRTGDVLADFLDFFRR